MDGSSDLKSQSAGKKKWEHFPLLGGKNWRDWAGLPGDILFDNILDRCATYIDDYDRFGRVCLSWREVVRRKFPTNIFMLVAPVNLYDLSHRRIYDFLLRSLQDKLYCGHSFGWLVTCDMHDVQLQNPFSRSIIHLPQLQTRGYDYVRKAVFSRDPLLHDNNVVVAIKSEYCGLFFYRAGNETWTSINKEEVSELGGSYKDVIFCRKTRRFYVLFSSGEVRAIEFVGKGETKLVQVALAVSSTSDFEVALEMYLVEDLSSGDLLQIHRDSRRVAYEKYVTVWDVFKLDPINRCWMKVDGIGDNVLFFSRLGSILRAVSDCPGYLPNCVYYPTNGYRFMEDFLDRINFIEFHMYNLEDGTDRVHHTVDSGGWEGSPLWLEPF